MCGRSSLTILQKELEKRFNATFYSDDLLQYNPLPNYNVAPTHMHPVITNLDQEHLQFFRWGLIPFWAKDVKVGYKMINARIETVLEKTAFKNAFKTKRCLVPFDGFYEWKKTPTGKQPYRIITKNTDVFSVAGLWAEWTSPEGKTIHSFTLLTQGPNELMKGIHDRMPAILTPEQEQLWLDVSVPPEDLRAMITPYPDEWMHAYPVSPRVGNVRENDKGLLEEVPVQTTLDL